MKYAIIVFGQYRSFSHNLETNLKEIKNSLLDGNDIDVYIVSDKCGNYSQKNTDKICNTFKKYNCNVKFIKLWENLNKYHEHEKDNKVSYDKNCKHRGGKHHFTSNLWYRRYVTNKIVNEYISENDLKYDLHMFIRLFDITIRKNVSDIDIKNRIKNCIENNKLLMSIDTIFIGTKNIINKVFSFGKEFNLYHDDIWNNKDFCNYFQSIDYGLYRPRRNKRKPTYCSEVQIFSHIFYNIDLYENIRYDFNNPNNINNKLTLFHVKLCPHRKKKEYK